MLCFEEVNEQGINGNSMILMFLLSKILALVGGGEKEGNSVILVINFSDELNFEDISAE